MPRVTKPRLFAGASGNSAINYSCAKRSISNQICAKTFADGEGSNCDERRCMSTDYHAAALKTPRPQTRIAAETKIDRRSPTRPRFLRGWQRTITAGREETFQAIAAAETPHVTVWVARTESLLRARSSFKVLTDDDWASLAQLRAETTRNSAMAAKILLRLGLSQVVGRCVEPRDWQFQRTPLGKPLISKALPGVNFSVSHADAVTVVAASSSVNVGIDVELIDQDIPEGTLTGFCHPQERAVLQKLTPYQKAREFVRIWTHKEAYTKLLGSGHSMEFSSIRCLRDEAAASWESDADGGGDSDAEFPSSICFESFFVSDGPSLYHVSLAVDAPKSKIDAIDVQLIDVVGPDRGKSPSGVSVVV
jgi:phosphopantetheinyl transferase